MRETPPHASASASRAVASDYLNAREVAAHLGVPKSSVYDILRRGLVHYRVGRRVRIHRADLESFLAKSRVELPSGTPRYGRYPPA